jgi:ATP-dependent Clp protease ATP-binding subunit ClpA
VFERFTDDARRVVVYAQEECRLLRHEHIGTEHLLLGLLREDTATSVALGEVGVSLASARERIGLSQGRGKKESRGHIPFTPRAKRVLEESLRHAQRLGQGHIARPHLLRALLDVRDGVAVRTLVDLGVDLDALAARADELALAGGPETESGRSAGIRVVASARRPGRRPRRLRYRGVSEPGDDLVAQLDDVVVQRDALANAVRRYARHDEDCAGAGGCTCGLQQVLDDLDSPGSGWTPRLGQ